MAIVMDQDQTNPPCRKRRDKGGVTVGIMTNRYMGGIALLIIVLAVMAQSQDSSPQQPLGDTAREQQQLRSKDKTAPTDKVYTNEDIGADSSESDSGKPNGGKTPQAMPINAAPRSGAFLHQRSVFDADPKKDSADDFIVIPAGTEIRVNLLERTVEAPVRVGFSTPVPASTKVVLHIYGNHRVSPDDTFGLGDYASITSLTIGDDNYPVRTNRIPCRMGQGVFRLSAPLRIKR